jgi:general secretion pathway protein K
MKRRGSLLVAVLLLAALLTVFVGVAGERLRVASAATRNAAEDTAADVAVRSAVELLYARTGGRFSDLTGAAGLAQTGLTVDVVARNEGTRVDLNAAAPELLAGIFGVVGVDQRRAEYYARVIVDRRRDPKQPAERRRQVAVPAQGPFEHVRELDRLREIPPEVVRAIEPFVTVTSLDARVAVLTAPREVVAALPGMDPGRIEAFLADRVAWSGKFETLMRRYGIAQDHVSREGSSATRLTMAVRIGSHRIRGYEVVVATLPGDEEPYRFLAWNGNAPVTGVAGSR